jgi:glyoxylate carboligase
MTTILLILRNIPAALSLLTTLATILKSDEVKQFFESIKEAVKKIKETPVETTPVESVPDEPQRLFQRFKNLFAQNMLGVNDSDFATIQRVAQRWKEEENTGNA